MPRRVFSAGGERFLRGRPALRFLAGPVDGRGAGTAGGALSGLRKGRILMRRLLIFVVLVGLGWGSLPRRVGSGRQAAVRAHRGYVVLDGRRTPQRRDLWRRLDRATRAATRERRGSGTLPLRRQPPLSGQGGHRRHHRRLRLGGVLPGPVHRHQPRAALHGDRQLPQGSRHRRGLERRHLRQWGLRLLGQPLRLYAAAARPAARPPSTTGSYRSTACRGIGGNCTAGQGCFTRPARRARCWCPSRGRVAATTRRCFAG